MPVKYFDSIQVQVGDNWVKVKSADVDLISALASDHNGLAILHDPSATNLATNMSPNSKMAYDFSSGIVCHCETFTFMNMKWTYKDDERKTEHSVKLEPHFNVSTWNVCRVVAERCNSLTQAFSTTAGKGSLPQGYCGGTDNCFRCGSAFGLFKWRHDCRVCKINFCADCMEKAPVFSSADEGACPFCKVTIHRDHKDRLKAKMGTNEFLPHCNFDAFHNELAYTLPLVLAAIDHEAINCAKQTTELLSAINPLWKLDADQANIQHQNSPAEQKSLAFARLLIACTQEGATMIDGPKSKITRDSDTYTCACWLLANARKVSSANEMEQNIRNRMIEGIRKGAAAARAFNPNSHKANNQYPLLDMLASIVSDPLIAMDGSKAAVAATKMAAKFDKMAGTLEQCNFISNYISNEAWQRELIRSFPDTNIAVHSLMAVFLYTLEEASLYRVLNTALREADEPIKKLVEPLREYLAFFLATMPARAHVVYRGQSYRVVEQLDENEPPAPLANFTSTTISFSVAYNAFLQGNRAGSFLIYIAYESVAISMFSSFEGEGEVLLPHAALFETVHRVPLSHLSIMNQRFDVACSQQIPKVPVRPSERVRLCMEALRAVSNAYREIQNYFIAPHLSHGTDASAPTSKLLDSVAHALSMPSDGVAPTWMCVEAVAGMGKSTLSIFINSFINETMHDGYHSLLISLPAVGKNLFDPDALENHMKRRLRLGEPEMALLRKKKFLVVLDSLDEVPIKQWPTQAEIGGSLARSRWPHLRVMITCRGEHLDQHHLKYTTLSGGRGVTYGIVPFQEQEVLRLVEIWIPGDAAEEVKAREAALKDYREQPASFHTPFMLYLLANSHRTASVEMSSLPPKPSFDLPAPAPEPGRDVNGASLPQGDTRNGAAGADPFANELTKIRDAKPNENMMARWAHENQHVDMLAGNNGANNVRGGGDAGGVRDTNSQHGMIDDEFGNPVGSPLDVRSQGSPGSPGHVAVNFNLASESGICAVYEKGIKALIAQNILHMGKVTTEELSRLVDDVFEWSQLVSIITLADDRWKATLGSLPELFEGKLRSYFQLDPTVMVLLAPLRISGYTSSAPFEFRHKSVHEFLAAFATANCSSTRRLEFIRMIPFQKHPNASHFLSQMERRDPINERADITCCVRYDAIQEVILKSRRAKRISINNVLRTDTFGVSMMGEPLQNLTHLELHCPAELVERILPLCPKLENLSLSHPSVVDATVAGAIQACPLRSINLSGTSVTEATLRVISQHVHDLRALDLSHAPCIQGNGALLNMSHDRLKNLSYLNLSGHVDKVNEIILHFAQSARDSLQMVDLSNSTVTDDTIKHLVSYARLIKSVDISGTHLSDVALRAILNRLGFLSSLSCVECRHLTDKPFYEHKDSIKSRNLLSLDFTDSPALITDEAFYAIAHRSSNLWGIECQVSPELKNKIPKNGLSDKGFLALTEKCPLLVHINVQGLQTVMSTGFSRLIQRVGAHIQYIDISHLSSKNMGIQALRDIVRYCENLRTLKCDNTFAEVDDPSFDEIEYLGVEMRSLSISVGSSPGRSHKVASGCNKLRKIHLHSDHGNTKVTLQSSEMMTIVRSCPNLQEIGVHRMKGVGDMSTFPKDAANLRSLEFSHIDGTFDDQTLIQIFAQCKLMRSVRIDDCGRAFTDNSIISIADNCPNLRIFSANATRRQISDNGAVHIARGCPQLVECNIVGAYGQVADRTLEALGKGCPELRRVAMGSNSGKIGDRGIIGLANGCHHLEYIDVADARGNIGGEAVVALISQCPNLRIMNVFNTGANIGIDALKVIGEKGTQLQLLQLGVTARGVKQEHLDQLLRELPLIDEIHFSLKA